MTTKEIFDHILSDNGSNAKMEILELYKENQTLQRALYLANSPRVKFYIKQIPEYTSSPDSTTLDTAMMSLSVLSSRQKTGHEASHFLQSLLSSLTPDDAYIIERIIDKDCKIGMGVTNINKIFPGLIEETPYMGAKAFSKKLVDSLLEKSKGQGVYSQIKMDGRYANILIESGTVNIESRAGEVSHLDGAPFIEDLKKFPDCVLNGELTMDGYNRYESNGIIGSIITTIGKRKLGFDVSDEYLEFEEDYKLTFEEALSKIRYTAWDTITLAEYTATESDTPYFERLNTLMKFISDAKTHMVSLIENRIVYTYAEAMEFFQHCINAGYEGNILKAIDGRWKDGKPIWQIKLKLEILIDLKITGFRYGKGKNKNVISSVEVESCDGLLKTAPTGIKEKVMKWLTENQEEVRGKILETKCSGISKDSEGNYSLLHPVYKEIRSDKTVADSLEQIIAIEMAAKGLK